MPLITRTGKKEEAIMKTRTVLIAIICSWYAVSAAPEAKITRIEGEAQVWKKGAGAPNGAPSWKPARLNMPLVVDDQLKSGSESLVEITYSQGAVMRLAENTTCSIKKMGDAAVSTSVPKGNVWVNMKKLASAGRDFELTTPTAVAAIRGTVFQMRSLADSSADVAVFDGKVAVGLSDDGKKRAHVSDNSSEAPHEVPGPTEVPGPYEVTLEQWQTIVAGQRISIRSNGTYATESFDLKKQFIDAFVKKNRALDAEINGAK
jgi:hypothetical protein